MTHVVIPVADELRNLSLPYALATIAEHTDYIPVTVGKNWGLTELHIPTVQQPGREHYFTNTDKAMRTACDTDWISDPFVWTADDIYWLHPAEPIRWAIGNLEDVQGSTVYAQRKRATAHFLHTRSLPTFDYEAHTPLLVHRTPMLETLNLIAQHPMLDKRSVYGNLTGTPDRIAPDVKVRSRADPLPPAPWASTEGNPARWGALAEALT